VALLDFADTLADRSLTGIDPLLPDELAEGDTSEKMSVMVEAAKEHREAVKELRKATKEQREATKNLATLFERFNAIQKPAPVPPPPPPPPSGPVVPPCDGPARRSSVLPHPSILTLLRSFLHNQEADFRCPEQAQALELVLAGQCSVFLIAPTGTGKSLVFLIPAMQNSHKVTIVIIPLSGLRIDFSRRCKQLNIPCTEWKDGRSPKSTIVIVSPEHLALTSFMSWADNLKHHQLLHLVVYDEVHILKTQDSFRDCLSSHQRLVSLGRCHPFRFSHKH